jgi:hypothetical protein
MDQMMKRVAILVSALALSLVAASTAQAKTPKGPFTFAIDTTVTCTAYDDAGGVVGTMTLDGSGVFNNKTKAASGGGNWDRNDGAGADVANGTWSVSKLTSFHSFDGTNPNWGGEAQFKASFTSGTTIQAASVWITNIAGKAPKGKKEGCRVNLKDVLNFNKSTAGTVSMTKA